MPLLQTWLSTGGHEAQRNDNRTSREGQQGEQLIPARASLALLMGLGMGAEPAASKSGVNPNCCSSQPCWPWFHLAITSSCIALEGSWAAVRAWCGHSSSGSSMVCKSQALTLWDLCPGVHRRLSDPTGHRLQPSQHLHGHV